MLVYTSTAFFWQLRNGIKNLPHNFITLDSINYHYKVLALLTLEVFHILVM